MPQGLVVIERVSETDYTPPASSLSGWPRPTIPRRPTRAREKFVSLLIEPCSSVRRMIPEALQRSSANTPSIRDVALKVKSLLFLIHA